MSQAELVRKLEGFGFGRKEPMGSRSYQTQKTTSEDVVLIALAGSTGLEPATSDVTGRRSNQTELTPQAVVRVCFRSRALRGLVYTEACPPRNNFFENIFWPLPTVTLFESLLFLAASAARGPRSPRRGCLRLSLKLCPLLKEKREMRSASPVFVAVTPSQ